MPVAQPVEQPLYSPPRSMSPAGRPPLSSPSPSRSSTHPATTIQKSKSQHRGRNTSSNTTKRTAPPLSEPIRPSVSAPEKHAKPSSSSSHLHPHMHSTSHSHSHSGATAPTVPLDRHGKPIDLAELRAKKQVQAFFKAFADSLEPTLRRTLSNSLSEQEKSTRARLRETVEEVLEEHKSRVTRELSRKRYEERLVRYHSAVQEYHSRKHTTIMLLLMEIGGITLLAFLYTYQVMSGHLGAIASFTLSAVYTIFMWRRSMLAPPKRPCPYESIAGPPPLMNEAGEEELPRPTWYERNLRWLPVPNRHTVKRAYGLFD